MLRAIVPLDFRLSPPRLRMSSSSETGTFMELSDKNDQWIRRHRLRLGTYGCLGVGGMSSSPIVGSRVGQPVHGGLTLADELWGSSATVAQLIVRVRIIAHGIKKWTYDVGLLLCL